MSSLVWSALAVVAAVGFGLGLWMGRRRREQNATAITRVDAHLDSAAVVAIPPPWPRQKDGDAATERTEASNDLALLDRLLRDIRDIAQADEAIFWRWVESRDTLAPSAWSTDGHRPSHFNTSEFGVHARWSAEQRAMHLVDHDDAVVFAAAPIHDEAKLFGVLTLTSAQGLPIGADGAREWMPRFAGQLLTLLQLFDTRRDHGRHIRQNEALISAVQQLQNHTSADALGGAVCHTAIEVTSACAAVLVRWIDAEDRGTVQAATDGAGLTAGMPIESSSLVANACRDALPFILTDARATTASTSPYGASVPRRRVGSLAIVPILRQHQVIGAIVVEGKEPDEIGQDESRNVGLLCAVIRGSLEIVWEIEAVTARARTDALTGLGNRRHFDEQLARVVAETDRFGGNCSLIVCDIDHFKRVNDTLGHEVGDAVLAQVARVLGEGVRTVDVCARYGGEEFAILLPQTPGKGAHEMAERLRSRLESTKVSGGARPLPSQVSITASFGVATYPEPVPYGDWLFLAADRALYAAKDAGRNCVNVISARDVTTKLYKKPT